VTDADLQQLSKLKCVRKLDLRGTKVTNDGLEAIHYRVISLFLCDTGVTDAGVDILVKHTNLKELDLSGTQISKKRVNYLHEKLPHCTITFP
jgi:hypothetical protein